MINCQTTGKQSESLSFGQDRCSPHCQRDKKRNFVSRYKNQEQFKSEPPFPSFGYEVI